MNRRIFVVGASRGLGLELTRHFRRADDTVVTSSRTNGLMSVGEASLRMCGLDALVVAAPLSVEETYHLSLDALSSYGGSVVVFSGGGVGGRLGEDHPVLYAANKAAIVTMVERLATLGKINAVAPGMLGIGMNAGKTADHDLLEKCLRMVDWLCSTESDHVRGRLLSSKWDSPKDFFKPMTPDDYRLRRVVPR